uniref:FoP_duplication domain-containing protein n=1 Tax=Rhabditophanes sp. KR3021 TaxID=114890 RepID=A0AC35U5E6_9BILA
MNSSAIDMSLDDIITKNKKTNGKNNLNRVIKRKGAFKKREFTGDNKSKQIEGGVLEISNLPFNIAKADVEVLLKKYSVRVSMKKNKNGRSSGSCMVFTTKKSEVLMIIKDFRGVCIDNRMLKLTDKTFPDKKIDEKKDGGKAKGTRSGKKVEVPKSVEDLDKELDAYMNH